MSIQLENEFFLITFDLKGAEIIEWFHKKKNTQLVWKKNTEVWKYQTPILFPKIGALKPNSYFVNGKEYCFNSHGFARTSDFTVHHKTQNTITFLLEENEETLKVYPFRFQFFVTYTLNEETLEMKMEVKNPNACPIGFELGYHPAFQIEDLAHTKITFAKAKLKRYQFLNQDTMKIHALDTDHLQFTLDDFKKEDTMIYSGMPNTFTLVNDQYRLLFETEAFTYIAFWTKDGSFLCVEPWSNLPDTFIDERNWIDRDTIVRLQPFSAKAFVLKMQSV